MAPIKKKRERERIQADVRFVAALFC